MSIQALSSRSWNGTPISRRTTDGYVNATAMCKANGKEWKHYFETDRCHRYLEALSGSVGIPTDRLFRSITTGSNDGRGTWVHPQVAVDLARWISAPFAVWMDGWFLEELAGGRVSQVRDTQPAPPALDPQKTLDIIERSFNLLERFGVADERDCLQFGDMVRNVTARAAGGLLLPEAPEREELTISDAWLELTGERLPRGKDVALGRLVAARYREQFDKEPPTRKQYVDGAPRSVKSYERGWLIEAVTWLRGQMGGKLKG